MFSVLLVPVDLPIQMKAIALGALFLIVNILGHHVIEFYFIFI